MRGATGAAGASILGSYETLAQLVAAHPTGTQGDAYLVGGHLYVWSAAGNTWEDMGSLIGPPGPTGVTGAIGVTGPTGATGLQGADGIIGEIVGISQTVAALPTTGVEQGQMYYVEEDGGIYLWDQGRGWVKLDVAQGPRGVTGPTGPTGPRGADGTIGTIQGVVDTRASLPTSGVAQGSLYYVEDSGLLYVWDTVNGWTEVDLAQGPRGVTGATGATGVTGVQGADGIIGEIVGISQTVAALPTTGVEQGQMYYVEEDSGIYLWDQGRGWVKLDVAQGPRGVTGPTGPTGSRGADGTIGTIQGVVDTRTSLPTSGVAQGSLYYVEDSGLLYVWDTVNGWTEVDLAQGPRGATGTTGAATSYIIIPFASTEAPYTTAVNGVPTTVSLLGYGYGDRRDYSLLTAADYRIPIDSDQSFLLSGTNSNKQLVFSLPFDVSIRNIYITVGNFGEFDPGHAVFPYVQLFSAAAGSNNFRPITGALAVPTEGIGPGIDTPANTMRSASTTGLDIKLTAGTRLAIGAMMQIPGATGGEESYWLYFTGGLGLTYEG